MEMDEISLSVIIVDIEILDSVSIEHECIQNPLFFEQF